MAIMVYALATYHWRAAAIRNRGSGPYDDRLGECYLRLEWSRWGDLLTLIAPSLYHCRPYNVVGLAPHCRLGQLHPSVQGGLNGSSASGEGSRQYTSLLKLTERPDSPLSLEVTSSIDNCI